MKVDRELHRDLLRRAADIYPMRCMYQSNLHSEGEFFGNLLYLEEHGLVEAGVQQSLDNRFGFYGFKATAKGLDFLADDGGLSAILGIVTVKLHDDTVRALLVERIETSDADPTVKDELAKQVRALPAEALKTLATRALEAGLRSLPNAIPMIHTWLSHL